MKDGDLDCLAERACEVQRSMITGTLFYKGRVQHMGFATSRPSKLSTYSPTCLRERM